MSYFNNKTICITGATSGIGEALAIALSGYAKKLILMGRNSSNLQATQSKLNTNCEVKLYQVDLANEAEIESTANIILKENEVIDILINNAGIAQRSLAIDTLYQIEKHIIQVNFFATIHLTKLLMPLLKLSTRPQLIIISSMSGKFGFMNRSIYSASKHALQGYFESMQLELAISKSPLKVTIVSPGRVQTNISLKALLANGQPHNKMDDGQLFGVPLSKCINKIIVAIQNSKKEVIIANNEHWLWYIKRLSQSLFYYLALKIKP